MSMMTELDGFGDRFWYWSGRSGKRYIHSVYKPNACPPLPGAVFVLVQRLANGKRLALEVGRFCDDWDYVSAVIADYKAGCSRVDEIHVHLLANSSDNADKVAADLEGGLGPRPVPVGFCESGDAMPAGAEVQENLFDFQAVSGSAADRSLAGV